MQPRDYRILVVDDQPDNRDSTQGVLEHWGYRVTTAGSGDEAITCLKAPGADYAVVLLDYKMPGKNGAQVAREIREFNQETVVAVYSCDSTQAAPLQSFRAGAIDFIEKNPSTEYLRQAVERACRKFNEVRTLKPKPPASEIEKRLASLGMAGRSVLMNEVADLILRYRSINRPVFITGESGTGKEHVARALHGDSDEKFLPVNCALFKNSHTLESTIFGHEKGAFTGADSRKIGLLESAKGGTVFLDEIHHMSLDAQAQLLRAVETKMIRRMGGNEEYPIDFRLIAATKPDIQKRVDEGTFYADLYYRLRYLRIEVPPLRARREDIEPLVLHFCEKYRQEMGQKKFFQARTIRMLESYDWPGNVRDLEGYVTELLVLCPGDTVEPKQLDSRFYEDLSGGLVTMSFADLEKRQEEERRAYLSKALRASRSVNQMAKRIRVPVSTLKCMLERLRLRGPGLPSETR